MFKVEAKLNKKHRLEAENILFETAPSNWMLSLNRKTKDLKLEGVFESEIEANQGVLQFEKFLSKNNYQVEVTELGNYWQKAYKEHFKPWSYNGYNFIPEWEKFNQVKLNSGVNIFIDPGMAFGTGTHETTRLCIELLIDNLDQKSDGCYSMLDVGCGSGILSILGQHIGFKSIHGIDNDENAIQNSLHNLSLNFHESTIKFEQKSIDSFENDSYDCIVANIQSDVLIKNAQRLVELLKNNGVLILSGILNYETEDVSKVYSKLFENKNMPFISDTKFLNEWCATIFSITPH